MHYHFNLLSIIINLFKFNFFKKINNKNNYNLIIFDNNIVDEITNFIRIKIVFKSNVICEILEFDFFRINFLLFISNVNNRSFKTNIFNIVSLKISII